ncbi:MAG: acetate--CoA ligase family protein [Ignavibacteriae bacterium]|nr:acetate--CoA ligase family protein [Ignavibacteriota bacterium]
MNDRLTYLFRPRSIAIIGASNDQRKRGYQAVQSLLHDRYEGKIYPINPKEQSILGITAAGNIQDVEDQIDLALIATPAKSVPAVLRDCGKKDVKGAIILAVGFGEAGTHGKKLEEEVVSIARENHIRIVGPNTSGMFNTHHKMNLTGIRDIRTGSMAILSQSGNMALSLITEINAKSNVGFSAYVGVGNEADIQFHEYLSYFKDDPTTNIIVMFVDGMKDGRKFLQIAKETVEKKPIVLLRSGRSEKGRQAARSHTGALAGLSAVSRTAFKRVGIITIDRSDELFPAAEALAHLPPLRRNRVAVLSDGGGHSALAADALSDYRLSISDLSEQTRAKLKQVLSDSHTIENPLDLAGASDSNPAVFADCAEVILSDPEIHALMIVGLFGGYHIRFSESLKAIEEETAHRLGKLMKELKKPVVVHSLYASYRPPPLEILKEYSIPVHESIDITAKCLSVLEEYGDHLNYSHMKTDFVIRSEGKTLSAVREIFQRAATEKRKSLLETEAREALRLHGIPVTEFELAATGEDAVAAARKIGYPVVLKIVSPDIVHKTDVGGVLLNIKNDDAVRDGFDLLIGRARRHNQRAKIKGVLVTPMMPEGVDIVVGVVRDPQFGPVIMVGLGGIMVEVVRDVSFRVIPLVQFSAEQMVEDIHSKAIFDGVRGRPPSDKKAIHDLLMQVSKFVEAYIDTIAELDLNPVVVYEKGLSVIDARMFLK